MAAEVSQYELPNMSSPNEHTAPIVNQRIVETIESINEWVKQSFPVKTVLWVNRSVSDSINDSINQWVTQSVTVKTGPTKRICLKTVLWVNQSVSDSISHCKDWADLSTNHSINAQTEHKLHSIAESWACSVSLNQRMIQSMLRLNINCIQSARAQHAQSVSDAAHRALNYN